MGIALAISTNEQTYYQDNFPGSTMSGYDLAVFLGWSLYLGLFVALVGMVGALVGMVGALVGKGLKATAKEEVSDGRGFIFRLSFLEKPW